MRWAFRRARILLSAFYVIVGPSGLATGPLGGYGRQMLKRNASQNAGRGLFRPRKDAMDPEGRKTTRAADAHAAMPARLFGNRKAAPFPARLAALLRGGASVLPATFLASVRRALCTMQDRDGLFRGRSGAAPDLYYTAFGVKALELLGHVWCTVCRARLLAGADVLFRNGARPASLSDLYSWLEVRRALAWDSAGGVAPIAPPALLERAQAVLEAHRTPDGAYARAPGQSASAQALFLGVLCGQMLGLRTVGPEPVRGFFFARRCRDGGFSDAPAQACGTTSATAAAAVLLAETQADAPDLVRGAREFLLQMQTDTGGFKPHASAPTADLLSTFVALVGLGAAGMDRLRRPGMIARFVRDCRTSSGAFGAAPGAPGGGDPEYTYYGLGALVLLAQGLVQVRE